MEASGPDAANPGIDGSADPCSSAGRLSVHQIVGGGKAADIILWKCRRATVGLIFGATIAWWLFEKSELSFLTICCDVLLILILVQFLWVKISGLLNKQPRPLPELVLSEEMVNNAAALFRVKVNNMLMIAHDITLGKDFRLFFQVVSVLWLLSVIGNFYSSATLAYIGTIALVTVPALYHRHQENVDRYAGMLHRNFSRHYKVARSRNSRSAKAKLDVAADIISWKCRRATVGLIFGATIAWWLFEKSELSFLTICCDVLLILILVQFLWVKISGLLNKQPRPLPELVLSEEMVNNAAALFRVKVNNMLMIAHDITLGKDFRLFFQVVSVLWLLSVIGNFYSSATLAYIGTIALVTVPALYHRHQENVDRYAGMLHRNFSRHYKVVDENVISRLPRSFIRDKDD
ncbi:hypothetical protein ACQ4PT_035383 [Festuca glaucescens]